MQTKNNVSDNALLLKAKNDSVVAAKKKAAAAEIAKLPKPYNQKENAQTKIAELVKQAKKENKNVMIQAGGNWCIWCLRFDHTFLNIYSKQINKNSAINKLYYH